MLARTHEVVGTVTTCSWATNISTADTVHTGAAYSRFLRVLYSPALSPLRDVRLVTTEFGMLVDRYPKIIVPHLRADVYLKRDLGRTCNHNMLARQLRLQC